MHKAARASMLLTYDDYCLIPNDGRRHEIIEGLHYMSPAPIPLHQFVLRRLDHLLSPICGDEGIIYLSPIDVILSDHDVVQPDLIFIADERKNIIGPKNIGGAPDLVVEVLSPSTADHDQRIKYAAYARHGVPHYWIVDPDARTLTEFTEPAGTAYVRERIFTEAALFTPRLWPQAKLNLAGLFPTEPHHAPAEPPI